MSGDSTPDIPAHRGRTVVLTADFKWHPLGGAAAEFRVEKRIELVAVPGGKCGVKCSCDIGCFKGFHNSITFIKRCC
jgi:hypothetical protein